MYDRVLVGNNPVNFIDPMGLYGLDLYGDWRDGTPLVMIHPDNPDNIYTYRTPDPNEQLVIDQIAQVTAQTLAYYYVHPVVGGIMTVLNFLMTITGIEGDPQCVN